MKELNLKGYKGKLSWIIRIVKAKLQTDESIKF